MAAHPDEKIARTDYNIHQLIKNRWSPRAFADKPVDPALIRQIFDAARWAPSCFNEQPWRFIVAAKDQPDEFDRMVQVLNEKNRRWATRAPLLMLTLIKDAFERNNKPNQHAGHDLGQAVSYMTLEATRHNLYLHQMAGILPDQARDLFHIPDHYTVITIIAAGYLGDPDTLPENLQHSETRERSRRSIDEIAFRGQWDNPERL